MKSKSLVKTRGKIIRKGGLLVWTGKVPTIPVEAAVKKDREQNLRRNA